MLRGIDHIVIVVRDLAQASADYERAGFTVTPGGEHTGGATHNALISFADGAYLELIAFKEPDRPQEHRWWSRLAQGEGLATYALGAEDVTAAAEAMRGRGLDVRGPNENGRLRPDGRRLAWRAISAAPDAGYPALPFVIEDVTPRELRVPGGAATQHRLPVRRLSGVTHLVADLDSAAGAATALLGVEGRPAGSAVDGAGAATLFAFGEQWIELVQPGSTGGVLAERLSAAGEGPYEIVLGGERPAAPGGGELLPAELTHGARIRVAR